jgi:hypothetical protein
MIAKMFNFASENAEAAIVRKISRRQTVCVARPPPRKSLSHAEAACSIQPSKHRSHPYPPHKVQRIAKSISGGFVALGLAFCVRVILLFGGRPGGF